MAQVRTRISDGVLEGEELDNVLGGKYYSFKGIPYASPPIGDLRFKAPQPVKPWDGVRNAKDHGPICHQFDPFSGIPCTELNSEDCLYLNVYTPNLKPNEPLPVMVWIHCGAFLYGSGNSNLYGPDFLVNRDVILVTFNYRLDIVGFLCLDTKEVPGNAGMKDQVAALRWVQKNIMHFGGDPNKVTIFGSSAGGASVAYHLVSPMTKGLFKRAIVQSGQNLSHWARGFEPRLRAEVLAHILGKDSKDDKELYEFFNSLPIEKLVGVATPLTVEEAAAIHMNLFLNVVDEKQFDGVETYFYGDVHERLRNGIHEGVEVVMGHTTHDGTIQFSILPEEGTFDKYNNYLQCFVPVELLLECPVRDQMEIGRKVKEFYFGDKIISAETVDEFIQYNTMQIFKYDILRYAKICAKNTKSLFFYHFDIYTERNISALEFKAGPYIKGKNVCHCDDLMYLFNNANLTVDFESESYTMIQNMTRLWTNFVKYGNPTPDNSLGVKWPAFDAQEQKYLYIGNELAVSCHPSKEELQFWENLHRKYLKH